MALPDFLPGRFALARGRPGDYFALEHFHYLPRRPATYADVWVVTYADADAPLREVPRSAPHEAPRRAPRLAPPPAAGVFRGREPLPFQKSPPRAAGLNVAFHFADYDARESRWRCAARREEECAARHEDDGAARVVAVGVLSFPSFRSTPRERLLNLRDLSHRDRTRFCNAHVRTVSRVVVHPQFRGLGLASEIVRKLIEVCTTRYVEASAVMAHVHPFFAAAGMRRIDDDRSEHDGEARPAYFIFDKGEEPSCGR